MARTTRRLIVLGSTGSIGTQTLSVVEHLNALHERGLWHERWEVAGLAAGRDAGALLEQSRRHGVREAALAGNGGPGTAGVNVRTGPDAAERLVREVEADLVLAAIVGAAGLPATFAAVQLGRDVALANKETLVAAGEVVVREARRTGARLLPVDSEHSGVWQCLVGVGRDRGIQGQRDEGEARRHEGTEARSGSGGEDKSWGSWGLCPPCVAPGCVARVVLTASGGPFRGRTAEDVYNATPEQALVHPTWAMGPKNTIDSATLMNKALEVIEAHWLFGLGAGRIGVLIHPQSIVHSLVQCRDGSTLAQMGVPDMRAPIQYALTHPGRAPGQTPGLAAPAMESLTFEPADGHPAVALAYEAIRAGGTAGAVLNGANEVAVGAFLEGRIPFGRIVELACRVFERVGCGPLASIDDAIGADAAARRAALDAVGGA